MTSKGALIPKLKAILKRRLKKKGHKAGVKILTYWKGTIEEDATWEDLEKMKRRFLDLVGKIL